MNSSDINKTDINMSVKIAGVEWKNPVTVASGTFGSGAEYSEFVDLNKLGAVTTKGVADKPWEGNPTPRVAEVYGGMLNAVGLQNPGIELFCKRDIPFLKKYDYLLSCYKTQNHIPNPSIFFPLVHQNNHIYILLHLE